MLTTQFFTGPLHLADLDKYAGVVQAAIDRYEPEYLEKTLGTGFVLAITEGLTAPIAQRWLDLRDGASYMVSGVPVKWNGLRNLSTLKSPIAGYVWWNYVRDTVQSHTSLGIAQATVENGQIVDPAHKAVQVWNEMVDETHKLLRFVSMAADEDGLPLYPEYVYTSSNIWGRPFFGHRLPVTARYSNAHGL